MTLVATAEATGADAINLDFTGVDGDTDGVYVIEYYIKLTGADSVVIQFNDDAGNAKDRRHTVNAAPATGTSIRIAEGGIDDVTEGRVTINAPRTLAGVARNRFVRCDAVWDEDATGAIYARLYAAEWANAVDNIVKISLVTASGLAQIAEGSWARLYKYPVA